MEKQQLQLEHRYKASNLNDPKNAPLIIMLHGYGSDENDLFSFASELPSKYAIISLKAPYSLNPHGNAWYAIHFDNVDGKWSDDKQAISSRDRVVSVINEIIEKYKIEDIICIDETSLKTFDKRKHCYSELGKRCIVKTHSQEVFKKYTGIFAISTKGVLGWKLYDKGGINSERLYDFLQEHITNKYKNKLIIMDNASSHRNQKIKDLVNKDNEILYSVPYQHFTNAIENWFSVLKSKLQKKEGLTYNHLQSNIENVLRDIQLTIFNNIFKGVYERPEKYKPKNKTRKIIQLLLIIPISKALF